MASDSDNKSEDKYEEFGEEDLIKSLLKMKRPYVPNVALTLQDYWLEASQVADTNDDDFYRNNSLSAKSVRWRDSICTVTHKNRTEIASSPTLLICIDDILGVREMEERFLRRDLNKRYSSMTQIYSTSLKLNKKPQESRRSSEYSESTILGESETDDEIATDSNQTEDSIFKNVGSQTSGDEMNISQESEPVECTEASCQTTESVNASTQLKLMLSEEAGAQKTEASKNIPNQSEPVLSDEAGAEKTEASKNIPNQSEPMLSEEADAQTTEAVPQGEMASDSDNKSEDKYEEFGEEDLIKSLLKMKRPYVPNVALTLQYYWLEASQVADTNDDDFYRNNSLSAKSVRWRDSICTVTHKTRTEIATSPTLLICIDDILGVREMEEKFIRRVLKKRYSSMTQIYSTLLKLDKKPQESRRSSEYSESTILGESETDDEIATDSNQTEDSIFKNVGSQTSGDEMNISQESEPVECTEASCQTTESVNASTQLKLVLSEEAGAQKTEASKNIPNQLEPVLSEEAGSEKTEASKNIPNQSEPVLSEEVDAQTTETIRNISKALKSSSELSKEATSDAHLFTKPDTPPSTPSSIKKNYPETDLSEKSKPTSKTLADIDSRGSKTSQGTPDPRRSIRILSRSASEVDEDSESNEGKSKSKSKVKLLKSREKGKAESSGESDEGRSTRSSRRLRKQ